MIYSDIIARKKVELQPEFDELFKDILKYQTHDGDLLLVNLNGFYHPEAKSWSKDLVKSPYMLGPNTEGHSDYWHYKFIHNYRKTAIANLSYVDYLKNLEEIATKTEEIDKLTESEATSIQIEMLIYLKIWEADLFIKKLYQLTNLAFGESYDWHFKIRESNRDTDSTGKREEIIRLKIRDKLRDRYSKLHAAIKNAYKTQIRNSISHSNYFFIGRHIHLGNYIKSDPASQIKVLSFDDWIDVFHDTLTIYDQMIRFSQLIDQLYSRIAENNNLCIEVRLNRNVPVEKTEFYVLHYRPEFKDWEFS